MSLCTYTVVRTARTTRTVTIEMDDSLYHRAMGGNTAARDKICIMVRQRLGLSGYVAWGSFTIDSGSHTPTTGTCDDCNVCDRGDHYYCRLCTL